MHHASRRKADVLVLVERLVINVEAGVDADVGEVVLEFKDPVEGDVVRSTMLLFRECKLSCLPITSGCSADCLA